MAATAQMGKDFGELAHNAVVVVLTDKQGLQPADEDAYRRLATKLRGETHDVAGVQDVFTTPDLRPVLVSPDNQAFFMVVTLRAPAGSSESARAYQRITDLAKFFTAGSSLSTHVTGEAAMVGDMAIISASDTALIEIVTAAMVLLILLVIYRRPVTVLLPLITIGITVATAEGVVSALSQHGLGVSAVTVALMTAMIFGAGTDYAVFLISRYHECIRSGLDSKEAVQRALGSIGKVIGASAATVAVTFLGMVLTRLPAFTSVGPALAISIVVAFLAAITLLPALLVIAGRFGWVKPRAKVSGQLWRRSTMQIVRRPKTHLLISLAVLVPLAACAAFVDPTYNDRLQLPQSAESNVGFSAMESHFAASSLLPQYIYVRSAHDLRTPQGLADLDHMALRVSQLPNIAAVRGITRPTGQPLEQTKLSVQAGEVGANLQNITTQINAKTSDLDALVSGADQLAAGLAEAREQIHRAARNMTELSTTLTQLQQRLGKSSDAATELLGSLRGLGNPTGPNAGQTGQALQNLQSAVQRLTTNLATADKELRSANIDDAEGARQAIAELEEDADAMAAEGQRLAEGVHTRVDETRQLSQGLNMAAELLLSMKRDAAQPSMAGLYIPQQVIASDEFKNAAKMFISADGHSARYLVETKFDPFSTAAMDQVAPILDTARGAQPNTTLSDASISVLGATATYSAVRSHFNADFRLIVAMTLLIVFAILVLLLRAVVAPLYLIASVVLSFMSALGLGVVVFQFALHEAISWNVQATAFIVLVAVGADYNLLLITRIREESDFGIRAGIVRAVGLTGGVITSAGVIFAASMFGLFFGGLTGMLQTGFIIGAGLLLDTFVVRTITVPAMAALVGRASWWPAKAARAQSDSNDQQVPVRKAMGRVRLPEMPHAATARRGGLAGRTGSSGDRRGMVGQDGGVSVRHATGFPAVPPAGRPDLSREGWVGAW